MTTKYVYSKLALACASFLAFAGLTATVAGRQFVEDSPVPAVPVRVQRIIIVQPRPTEVPTEAPPLVQAAPAPPAPVSQVPVPKRGPVTRTRGS